MTKQMFLGPDATALARMHTAEAIGTLVTVMRTADKDSSRVAAAQAVLDRGHGRAVQATIAIPARHAKAMLLATMSDDALLRIARGGGSGGQNEGPIGAPGEGGSHTADADCFVQSAQPLQPGAPSAFRDGDVQEAEFTELDEVDPCS